MGELVIETELLVIGGGPGGYAAAFRAADLGLDVTLLDIAERPGGRSGSLSRKTPSPANPYRRRIGAEHSTGSAGMGRSETVKMAIAANCAGTA